MMLNESNNMNVAEHLFIKNRISNNASLGTDILSGKELEDVESSVLTFLERICPGIALVLWKPNKLITPIFKALRSKKFCIFPVLDLEFLINTGFFLKCSLLIAFDDLALFTACHKIKSVYIYKFENNCNFTSQSLNGIGYLFTTSGSTGKEKLVGVTEECVSSNISSFIDAFNWVDVDYIILCSPLTFDPSLIVIRVADVLMKTLVILDNDVLICPHLFATMLESKTKSFVQLTPSLFSQIVDSKILSQDTKTSSCIVLGGEPISHSLFVSIFKYGWKYVYSIYGVTEVSCWSAVVKLNWEQKKFLVKGFSPIGAPLVDSSIKLGSDDEIISGINCNEILLKRFSGGYSFSSNEIDNFVSSVQSISAHIGSNRDGYWHKTGDFGLKADSCFYFVSRKDRIVKRNGLKISLSKIENFVTKMYPNVVIAAKCFLTDTNTLFLNLRVNSSSFESEALKSCIFKHLGSEHLPDLITTEIGKRLPDLSRNFKYSISCAEFFTDIILSVLCGPLLDLNRSFYEQGGNSLLAMYVVNQISALFADNIKNDLLMQLISNESLGQIINQLDGVRGKRRQVIHADQIKVPTKTVVMKLKDEAVSSLQWNYNLGKCIDASPLFIDDDIVIGSHSGILTCIRVDSGIDIWTHSRCIDGQRIEATAAYSSVLDQIIFGTLSGEIHALRKNGTHLWSFMCEGEIKEPVLIIDDLKQIVFGCHKSALSCLDISQVHPEVKWQVELDGSPIRASGCYDNVNETVIYGTLSGRLFCLRAKCGTIVWKSGLSIGPIFAASLINSATGRLITATASGCVAMHDIISGKKLSTLSNFTDQSMGFFMQPVMMNLGDNETMRIAVSCQDGCVYIIHSQLMKLLYVLNFMSFTDEKQKLILPPVVIPGTSLLIVTCAIGKVLVYDQSNNSVIHMIQPDGDIFSVPKVKRKNEHEFYIIFGCRNDHVICHTLSINY